MKESKSPVIFRICGIIEVIVGIILAVLFFVYVDLGNTYKYCYSDSCGFDSIISWMLNKLTPLVISLSSILVGVICFKVADFQERFDANPKEITDNHILFKNEEK